MNKNQKGFAVFESIIIALYVITIGVGGFLVWHNEKNKNKLATPTSTQAQATTTTTPYTTTFSKVPSALQTVIVSELKKDVPACVNSRNQIVSELAPHNPIDPRVDYDASGFAATGIGCGDGSWGIFADVDSNWKFLEKTQMGFDCSILNQYKFPKALLELNMPDVQCFDSNNNLIPYQPVSRQTSS